MRRILVISALLVLGGCAVTDMNRKECKTADWRAVGYGDGANGRSADSFSARQKSCAKHGVAADFDTYLVGHGQGLAVFCRPQNGYSLGSKGYRYSGICPADLDQEFRAAHADGYGLFQRAKARDDIANKLRQSKHRAKDIENQLLRKTVRLSSARLRPAQRRKLAVDIRQLAEEKGELQQYVSQLERDHAVASEDYEAYRRDVADRYRG